MVVTSSRPFGRRGEVFGPAVPEWREPLLSFEHEAAYEYAFADGALPGLLPARDGRFTQ
ncbi:hypothetical protein [Streptomyces synnematoformans]|uniref:Uncharacterized protein n=1 Tax=Streptomyces synnematoformans TaxID=415721 RepID=A0ABP5JEB4_9ACTN